ncbi:MAG: glycosyltransferase family 2 protein [Saprospiraceae bacterium]
MKPLVSIITVNYRQEAITCALLQSIRALNHPSLEVIVVDNGFVEDNTTKFQESCPSALVFNSKKNLGFAGGNNLGIRHSSGQFLFLVNNDTVIGKGLIDRLLQRFDTPGTGMVSPKIRYFDAPDVIQYAGFTQVNPLTGRNACIGQGEVDRGQHDSPRKMPYAHGAAMMVSREVIDKVGVMDEGFFLYYEELDWCEQIRRAGFDIWYEPSAMILHKESVSTGKASPLKMEYLTRNRIRFMRRNFGGAKLAVFLLFFYLVSVPVNTVRLLSSGNWSNLKAFYSGAFRQGNRH